MFSFPRSPWYPDLRNVISAKIPLNGFIGFIFWTGILLLAFNRSNSSSKAVTVGLALAYSGSSRISSHFGPSLKEISPLKMWRSPILIGQVSKSTRSKSNSSMSWSHHSPELALLWTSALPYLLLSFFWSSLVAWSGQFWRSITAH